MLCKTCGKQVEKQTNGYHYYSDVCRKCKRHECKSLGVCVNCRIRPASDDSQRCEQCRDVKRACDANRYERRKLQAFVAYSTTDPPTCCCCGIDHALTIDHINNDGAEHRKSIGIGSGRIYNWLHKYNYPAGFRTLCFNCNSGRIHGICPHSPEFIEPLLDTRYKRYSAMVKQEVLAHYSNGKPRCTDCGESNIRFLTLDHINGNGTKHRAQLTKSVYKWARSEHFPPVFNVLCFNCNYLKSDEISTRIH